MKRKVLKSEKRLKAILYYTGKLKEYEIVAFKTVYLYLCQRYVKDRADRLKDHYKTIVSAFHRDQEIQRIFHAILKCRMIYPKYEDDLRKLRPAKNKGLIHIFHKHELKR